MSRHQSSPRCCCPARRPNIGFNLESQNSHQWQILSVQLQQPVRKSRSAKAHLCQQSRAHLWVDTARQPTTSLLRPCSQPGRPSLVFVGRPPFAACQVGTSTGRGGGAQGHGGSCSPPALAKAAGVGPPSPAWGTDAGCVCGCEWGSGRSWRLGMEWGRQRGTAPPDHRGCWGSCYCCCCCRCRLLNPS